MGNSCRGSFKDKIFQGSNSKLEDNSKTSTHVSSDHSSSDHSPTNNLEIISPKKDNNNNSQNSPLVIPLREPIMRRNMDNQAYYVLGHKTPNIRDLYTLSRKLGQGQFGTTYLCTELATGVDYACKSISKRKLISKEDVEDVRREIQIMHHLAGHGNIVTIKGAYEDTLYVHIVMELCAGGELFDRIIQRGHYSERKAAELTKIIVGVVEACHSLGVMHRDLKPENFLLVNKDDDFSLKAIDFGLSVFFKPGQIFTDVVGSPYYVAPEVLLKRYGPEADVWTAGVILYILLSGVPPYWAETQQGIFDAVLKGYIDFDSDPWPVISDSAKDLIRRMLCSKPAERLTAHEVLRHPWICENGVAPDRPLDPAVLSRLKQFSAMNKLKKMALSDLFKITHQTLSRTFVDPRSEKLFHDVAARVEERETQLTQQSTDGLPVKLSTQEMDKIFEEVAPKKKGRIVGIGSVNEVPKGTSSYSRRDEENAQLRAQVNDQEVRLQFLEDLLDIMAVGNPLLQRALDERRQTRQAQQPPSKHATEAGQSSRENDGSTYFNDLNL